MQENRHEKDPIELHQEWQRHQYDPGHYRGGNVPHFMTHPSNKKKFGFVFLGLGLLGVALGVQSFLGSFREGEDVFYLIVSLVPSCLLLAAAVSLFRRKS